MAVNYAIKYSKEIANRFTANSFVKPNTSNKLNFTGAKTVRMYQLVTVPENDYKRSGSNRFGVPKDIDDIVLEYTMERDKAFTGVVDKGDEKDQPEQGWSVAQPADPRAVHAQCGQVLFPQGGKLRSLRKVGIRSWQEYHSGCAR